MKAKKRTEYQRGYEAALRKVWRGFGRYLSWTEYKRFRWSLIPTNWPKPRPKP